MRSLSRSLGDTVARRNSVSRWLREIDLAHVAFVSGNPNTSVPSHRSRRDRSTKSLRHGWIRIRADCPRFIRDSAIKCRQRLLDAVMDDQATRHESGYRQRNTVYRGTSHPVASLVAYLCVFVAIDGRGIATRSQPRTQNGTRKYVHLQRQRV